MGRAERARWESNEEVRALLAKTDLTDTERESLRRYTGRGGLIDTAWAGGQFFTPERVGQFIADVLEIPDGAAVLDPQAGVGRLLWPFADHCQVTAVEIDSTPAEVARRLMPAANVICSSVEDAALVPESFDAVVANPPFGIRPTSPVPWRGKPKMETWTFAYALRMLRPGGVAAFVVPDGIPATSATSRSASGSWTTRSSEASSPCRSPPSRAAEPR